MANVGNANIRITADDTQATRALSRLGRSFSGVGRIAAGVAGGMAVFGAISSTLQGLGQSTIGANADMEQYQNTLSIVMKSNKKATEAIAWAQKFAAQTPFEIPEIVEATAKLTTYGINAKDTLGSVGDMASAMGKPLDQAVEAIADAQTGELERLKEFGITKGMLIENGRKMGLKEFVNAKGQITNQELLNKSLFNLMDSRYKGSMELQSKTFRGLISNIKDQMGTVARELSKPLFEKLKQGMEVFLPVMVSFFRFFKGGTQNMTESLEILTDAFGETTGVKIWNFFNQLLTYFNKVKATVAPAFNAANAAVAKFMAILFAFFQFLNRDLNVKLTDSLKTLTDAFGEKTGVKIWNFFNKIQVAFNKLMDLIRGLRPVFSNVVEIIKNILPVFMEIGKIGAYAIGLVVVGIVKLIEKLTPLLKWLTDIARKFSAWEGFVPVVMGIVTAIAAYRVGMIALAKAQLALNAVQKAAIFLHSVYRAAVIASTLAGGGLKGALAALRVAMRALNLTMLANPFVLVAALIAGLVVGLVIAYKRSETFRNIVNGAFNKVKEVAKAVFSWFKTELPKLGKQFYDWANKAYADTVGAMVRMKDRAVAAFKAFIQGADNLYAKTVAAMRKMRDGAVNAFKGFVKGADELYAKTIAAFRSVIRAADNLYAKTISAIRRLRDGMISGLKTAWEWIKKAAFETTKFVVQKWIDALKMVIYVIKNWRPLLKAGFNAAYKVVSSSILAMAKYVAKKFTEIVGYGKALPGRIARAFKSTYNLIKDAFVYIAKYMAEKIYDAFTRIIRFYRDLPGRVIKAFKSNYVIIKNAFIYITKYMMDKISEAFARMVRSFRDLSGRVIRAFKSTYKLIKDAFIYIGKYMRDRISDTFNALVKYFKELPGRVTRAFKSTYAAIKNVFIYIAKYIRDKVTSTFNSVVSYAKALPGRMGSAIRSAASKTFSAVSSLVSGMMKRVRDAYNSIVDGAKKLPGRIGDGIKSMSSKAYKGMISVTNSLLKGMGRAVNGLVGGINTILSKLEIKDRLPKWKVPQYAQGTKGHPGGPAILGDGNGRELFRTPQGLTGLSPDRDTLYNLPKGTTVLSAEKTKKLLGRVPKYAGGVGDFFNRAKDWTVNKYDRAKAKASDIKSFFKDKVKDIWDYASNPSKLIDMMVKELGLKMASGSGVGKIAGAGMNMLIKKTRSFIKSKFDLFGGGEGGVNVFKGLTKTQGFGKAGGSNGYFHHDGVDYAGPLGSFIKSVTSGKVSFAGKAFQGYGGGFGNLVKVASGAYEHFYGHLQKVIAQRGQPVTAGQTLLGTLGSTGNSTGPHVHYEVRKNGTPVDPMPFLTGKGVGGNLATWIRKAMAIRGVKGSEWFDGLYTIAKKESGGNPNAVNNWDSNARAGIPSKGLMQMIGPTFSAHMKKGYGNILNPIDNVVSAIGYIKSRYGNIFNVPGLVSMRGGGAYRGYEYGGFIRKEQLAMVGEGNKAEVVIPLQNSRAMKPFSDAVARNLNGNRGPAEFKQENNFYGHRVLSPAEAARKIKQQSQKIAEQL